MSRMRTLRLNGLGIREFPSFIACSTFCAASLASYGCQDASKSAREPFARASLPVISDQAHSGGQTGFFWLPPLVSAPALQGTFDPGESPVVTVTPLAAGATPIATYTMTSGPGSETIQVDPIAQNYSVVWHTDQFDLDPSLDYRIAVLIAGRTAGFLDVDVVTSKAQAKNVDTQQFVPLVDGKTLPIKWYVNACGSVLCTPLDQCHNAGTCDANTGVCSSPNLPDGTACDDGQTCTQNDQCNSGTCGGTPFSCIPGECQIAGTCNEDGSCSFAAVLDGTACSGGTCQGGVCMPPPSNGCSGSWTSGQDMNLARTGMATAVVGGRFYVLGGGPPGGGATGSVEVYDPASNVWTTKTASTARRTNSSAVAINGKIYLAGGCTNSDCLSGLTDLLEEYDPELDSWSIKQPMPTARTTAAAGVINGKLYVAGGMQQCPPCNPIGTLQAYDPSNDAWATLSPMPKGASHLTRAAVYGGQLYVVGGDDYYNGSGLPAPDPLSETQVYDPATDQWSTVKAMPTARSYAGVEALNGFILVVSGQVAGGSVVPLVEVYNPLADSWCTGVPIPTPHFGASCGALNGSLYCVGASTTNTALANLDVFTPSP